MRFLFSLIIFLNWTTLCFSQWSPNPDSAKIIENSSFLISDNSGFLYNIQDYNGYLFPNTYEPYLEKTDLQGNRIWIQNVTSSSRHRIKNMVSDNQGGVIILFYYEAFNNPHLYDSLQIKRYDGNGNMLWATSYNFQLYPGQAISLDTDSLGGGYFTWYETNIAKYYLKTHRFLPNGSLAWINPITITDDLNNTILSYRDNSINNSAVKITHLASDGSLRITWCDKSTRRLVFQKIDPNGTLVYTNSGIDITIPPNYRVFSAQLLTDALDNTILVFDTDTNTFAQKISPNGNFLWGSIAKLIPFSFQGFNSVSNTIENGSGGFYSINRFMISNIDSLGNVSWTKGLPNGIWYESLLSVDAQKNLYVFTRNRNIYQVSDSIGHIFGYKMDSLGNDLWTPDGISIFTSNPIIYLNQGDYKIAQVRYQSDFYISFLHYYDPLPIGGGISHHDLLRRVNEMGHLADSVPIATAGVSSNNWCTGDSLFFQNYSGNAVTYLWHFGDGDSSSLYQPIHSYSDTGNYTVSLIASNIFGSDTFTFSVNVNPSSVPEFSLSDSLICYTDTLFISNSTVYSLNSLWDFGDATTDSGIVTQKKYLTAGIYNVCLTTSDQCRSTKKCEIVHVMRPYNAYLKVFEEINSIESIVPSLNNGYYLTGLASASFGFLQEMNRFGDINWFKYYNTYNMLNASVYTEDSLWLLSEDKILIKANIMGIPSIGINSNLFNIGGYYNCANKDMIIHEKVFNNVLYRFGFDGNLKWSMVYDDFGQYGPSLIREFPNHDLLMSLKLDDFLLILDSLGHKLAAKRFDYAQISAMEVINNEHFVVSTTNMLIKLDRFDNIIWQKNIQEVDNSIPYLYKYIKLAEDSSIVVSQYSNYDSTFQVIKFNKNGDLLWANKYKEPGVLIEINDMLLETDGILLVGRYNGAGMLLKLDYKGGSNCITNYPIELDTFLINLSFINYSYPNLYPGVYNPYPHAVSVTNSSIPISIDCFYCDTSCSINDSILMLVNPISLNEFEYQNLSNISDHQWVWSFGDGSTDTSISGIHIYNSQGVFDICLTKIGACVDQMSCTTIVSSIVTSNTFIDDQNFKAYPNPANENLIIENNLFNSEKYSILDLQGRLIDQGLLSIGRNELEVKNISQGTYILKVREKTARFIVVH